MTRSSLKACAALLLALCFSASAAAPREVRLGLYENPPKIHTGANGTPQGFFVDVIEAIGQEEDWRVHYVPCVWDECLALLKRGEIDLMPDIAYSDRRASQYSFNRVSVLHGWTDVVVPANRAVHVVDDLAGLRIAVLDESIQQASLQRLMQAQELPYVEMPVKTLEAGFTLVRQGRADAAISNNFFTSANVARHGLFESAVLFEPVMFYFAASKGQNADLLARIDMRLRAWKIDADSPYFAAMRDAFVPRGDSAGLSRPQRVALTAFAILALLGLAWILALRWQVRRQTAQLSQSNAKLKHLLGAIPVVLYQIDGWDEQPRFRWQDSLLSRLFGFEPHHTWSIEEWLDRVHEEDRDRVRRHLLAIPHTGRMIQKYRLLDARGSLRQVRDEAHWLAGNGQQGAEVVGCLSDLTDANEQADRLKFLTHHDELTSLANRTQLELALATAVETARSNGTRLALLLLNLDRLQRVNDAIGHEAGDAVLIEMGRRIQASVGAGATVARLGGDEFAVVLSGIADTEDVAAMGRHLLSEVKRPLAHAGHMLTVTASIGVSLFPDDGATPAALLMGADTALAHAKQEGRNRLHFATAEMNTRVQRWMSVERQLRFALERGEFSLQFQPMASLSDGSHCGVEALLRWHNQELGSVSPVEFIPIAEDAGLMEAIGEWVLRSACAQAQAWKDQGLPPIRMAVNVSAQQIHSGTLPGLVRAIRAETGFDLHWLEIELTESVMMQDSEAALAQIQQLAGMGVSVSLDDFGTGFSSLSYLSRFPFETLKIDQSFIQRMIDDPRSAAITHAAIGIAHGLDMKVVAEGVETREQLDYLCAAQCDEMQGFLLSRPVEATEISRLFAESPGLSVPPRGADNPPRTTRDRSLRPA